MRTTHQTPWMQICLAVMLTASANINLNAQTASTVVTTIATPKVTFSAFTPPSTTFNVAEGTQQAYLGQVTVDVANAPVQLRRENAHFYLQRYANGLITGVTITEAETGKVLAGPKNPFTSSTDGHLVIVDYRVTNLAVGRHTFVVRANLSTGFKHDEMIKCGINPLGFGFLDLATGKGVVPTPWKMIMSPTVTVKTAWLTASLGNWPPALTVISGSTNHLFETLMLDTTDSSEDIAVDSITTMLSPKGASGDNLMNLKLWNGKDLLYPVMDGPAAGMNVSAPVTFALTKPVIIPKGKLWSLTLTGDVSTATLGGSAFKFSLLQSGNGGKTIDAYGTLTGQAATLTIKDGFAAVQTVMRATAAPGLVTAYGSKVFTVDPQTQMLTQYEYEKGTPVPTTNPPGTVVSGAVVNVKSRYVDNPIAVGYQDNKVFMVSGDDQIRWFDADLNPRYSYALYDVRGLVKNRPTSVISGLGIIDLEVADNGQMFLTGALWLNNIRDAAWINGNLYLVTNTGLEWYKPTGSGEYTLVQHVPMEKLVALSAYKNFVDVLTTYSVCEYWNDDTRLQYVGAAGIPAGVPVQLTSDGDGIYLLSSLYDPNGLRQAWFTRFGILPNSAGQLPVTKSLVSWGQARDMGRSYDPIGDQFDGTEYLMFDGYISPFDFPYESQ